MCKERPIQGTKNSLIVEPDNLIEIVSVKHFPLLKELILSITFNE